MQKGIKQLPELERPYEKLEIFGEKMLSNAELLAIIIKTGTREKTSLELAQEILHLGGEENNNLIFLRELSIQELMKIKGIGKIKAFQIKAAGELAVRFAAPRNYLKIVIKEPKDVAELLIEELRILTREVAKIVILDNKNKILKIKDIAIGGTNVINISIKDILTEPIKMNAPKIIIVHNHPSGDPTPSQADINFTERLFEATNMVDIELLDHIVIGDKKYVSIFSNIFNKTKD